MMTSLNGNQSDLRRYRAHYDVIVVTPMSFLLYVRYYNDIIMGARASQITSLTIVYSTVFSGVDQRKHKSSASLAFVPGIHRWPVSSPHKWPETQKMLPFDDVTKDDEYGEGYTFFMAKW